MAPGVRGAVGADAEHRAEATRGRSQCILAVAPVDVALTKLPADGSPSVRIRLDATAQADCDAVTLSIDVPAEVPVVSGSTSWSGSLARGTRQSLTVELSVADTAQHKFLGVAEVRRGSARLLRQSFLQIGNPPPVRSAPRVDPVITAPDGTRMMVLPAREVSP